MSKPHWEDGKFYCVPRGLEFVLGNLFEFVVLSRLLDRADDHTGKSFPSYRDLSMGMMSRYQAILVIKSLKSRGIISIQHNSYKANTYTLHYDVLKKLIKTSQPHRLVNDIDQSTTLTGQPRRSISQPTRLQLVNGVDPNDNHITKTNNNNTADANSDVSNNGKKKTLLLLPDWVDKATWNAFLEIRKKKHAPDTDHALALIVRDLEMYKNHGDDPNKVLEESIKRGWTGVFELKSAGKSSGKIVARKYKDYEGEENSDPSKQ
jgi:hypothetical protein